MKNFGIALVLLVAGVNGAENRVNPIRKVVTMLQNMQKQVTEEGEKQKELFEKFMCYCKNGRGDLEKSIEDAKAKIANFEKVSGEKLAKKKQTEQDLEEHKADRAEAKEAMKKATEIRKKEAAAYAKESSDLKTNIDAVKKAVVAIEKGMTGFLQTSTASLIRSIAIDKVNLQDTAREELLAFLSGSTEYAPQSGEIVGILKQMGDEMGAALADATAAEDAAKATYEALMSAKKKEVEALSAQIEEEIKRVGELAVELAGMANELEDTKEALAEDTKFLEELNSSCDKKAAEWEVIQRTRAEELLALADTIKILNSDDALELFKQTLPSASSSFLQVEGGFAARRNQALSIIRQMSSKHQPSVDFLEMALQGKKGGFDKVIKMIDEMIENLKGEQADDDQKKAYCEENFDKTEDQKKALEQSIHDSEVHIEELDGAIAQLRDEIAALEDAIKALDKSVAEATEQRKQEHADYTELMANDGAAKEVLAFAKNRLNKFYNPALYVPPPKRTLSEQDQIVVSMGGTLAPTMAPGGISGTGITALQARAAPGPPPATFGAYQNKGQENNGVISMIDLLVKDLDKEMQESKVEEDNAQKDYEKTMQLAAEKRAQDSKAVTDKTAFKAKAEEELQAEQDAKKSTTQELGTTLEEIHALHGECDWLMKYFDARKEARAGEVQSLARAKDVLNGADYSLIQTHHNLRARGATN